MASIRRQILIDADPAAVWDALRQWDALHERLAAGFVTDCRRDGLARIVTFASGAVLREEILGCDDEHRRLDAAAQVTAQAMERGLDAIRRTLERQAG